MPKLCSARIVKEYATVKAGSLWPNARVVNGKLEDYPICGGVITFKVRVTNGCCCHDSGELDIEATCSRCKNPYYEGIENLIFGGAEKEIERMLNG